MARKTAVKAVNLVPNHDFSIGRIGQIPEGWEMKSQYPFLTPVFKLVKRDGRKILMATGGGNPDCVGWAHVPFTVTAGKTYRMWVKFGMSKNINPDDNLIFSVYKVGEENKFNNGILLFDRLSDTEAEGENRFVVPGEGDVQIYWRIYFRYSASGKAWIEQVGFEECEPIKPRLVRVMSTGGQVDLETWARVLDAAAQEKADLVLLPETFNGLEPQPINGPEATLMSKKAKEHKMYVAGSFQYKDAEANRVYNAAMLYDRKGKLVGKYYKLHPYSPESFEGVTPGTEAPVFDTDFGCVGMIICYDSWFTDVTELLALKGAEIILFPCAGYFESLMPARAADNGVRMVASSLSCGLGIWDTTGADVRKPDADSTKYADSSLQMSDVREGSVGEVKTLAVTFDLSHSESPHNWGGPMLSAPGGRRVRRDQKRSLLDDIKREQMRWWKE